MKNFKLNAAWLVGAALAMPVFAEDAAPQVEPAAAPAAPAFNYQTGEIVLPNKVATLHLGEKYRYLDPNETSRLLVEWGNEADTGTQGAIVPTEVDPLTVEGWAVILTYVDDGHIDDSDANEIDYDDLLKDMKSGQEDYNDVRKEHGFPPMHIVGWAEKPHYDAATKKLYWAKELAVDGAQSHSLNYDVRVLGREGVLSMNAVARLDQLSQIRSDMTPILTTAEFNSGYRYAEFNSKTDKLAEYGLGALIAGAVGAKLGLFAKLFALLIAFKKVLIVGLVAAGGFIAKLFKKKDAAA